MATLYVRNVPDDLYEQLRKDATASRRSLGAEAVERLRLALAPGLPPVPLDEFLKRANRIREEHPPRAGSPSAAELIREDRDR
jgi:plasmid stability protein